MTIFVLFIFLTESEAETVKAVITYILYQYMCLISVDGGHRAIIFSRLGGVQEDVYVEGLHFRFDCHLLI